MLTANVKLLGIVILVCAFCYGNAVRFRRVGDLSLVMDLVEHQYVDEAKPQDLYHAAMKGMIESLDPYSGYVPPESLRSFRSVLEQEFGGLGVSLDGPPRRDRFTVVSALFDSPAYRAGVKPGDVILEVNDRVVENLQFNELTNLLRGREGSKVNLLLERLGEENPILVEVTRGIIEVESVLGDQRKPNGKWEYRLAADPSILYIRIELFGEKTETELKHALESASKDCRGIIIDLRDNSGGLLEAATQICDYFLDDGEIVSTRGRNGAPGDSYVAKSGVLVPNDVPLVVLINENSASASEIMAACLQDRKRAKVVGTRSFGKGSVQNVIPLEGGQAAMRLTTAYYFPPNGRMIHRRKNAGIDDEWGVLPDKGLDVSLAEEQLVRLGERVRKRADPVHYVEPNAEAQGDLLERDPSLADDPQLLKAVNLLVKP
jgi:carboxyl-terminal processing protease